MPTTASVADTVWPFARPTLLSTLIFHPKSSYHRPQPTSHCRPGGTAHPFPPLEPRVFQRKSFGRAVTAHHRGCPSGPDGNQCTRSQNGIGHPPGNLEGGQPYHHRYFYVDSKLGGKSVTEIDTETAYAFGLSLRAGVQKTA